MNPTISLEIRAAFRLRPRGWTRMRRSVCGRSYELRTAPQKLAKNRTLGSGAATSRRSIWQNVHLTRKQQFIEVPAPRAKTRQRRIVSHL